MFITISIQTYNHAETLAATLKSLCKLRCPEAIDYEILVVDNNSSDNTKKIIATHSELLAPRLRSVFESRQGLSYARNRTLREARGEVVGFLDDDINVDSRWLVAVSAAFIKYKAAAIGGRSYLIYPTARPNWLPPEREVLLSRLDYGDMTLVNTDKDLFGLNFAVRRQKALEIGGFNTKLGRCGESLLCGEEKDFLDRLRQAGGMVVYEPKVVVGHIVSPERLTKKWFFRRIYAGAVSSQRRMIANGQRANVRKLLMSNFRCWGGVVKNIFKKQTTEQEFFEREYFAIANLGRLVEAASHGIKSFLT